MTANARLIALQALLRVHKDDGYSNIVLNQTLKKAGLNARDAGFVSALFYGVLERMMTLDYMIQRYSKIPLKKISPDVLEILRLAFYQLCYMDKVPPSAAVNEAVSLARLRRQEKAAGFINAVLRSFVRAGSSAQLPEGDSRRALSIRHSCPEWIIALWQNAYGQQTAKKLLEQLAGRPPLTIRANNLKSSAEELSHELEERGLPVKRVAYIEGALQLKDTGSIETNAAFREGKFHVQDLASQICCLALGPKPGECVIDVCSAPGGKAFTIAERMENQGELLAFDLYEAKVNLIREGARRLGITILKADVRDAANPETELPPADRVLCDVPCSGLGILRRKPEIRYKNPESLDSLPDLQYRILRSSARLCKPQGVLLYSTCTLNPAENGRVADRFLREHPDFAPLPLLLPQQLIRNSFEPEHQLSLMPHLHGTDGFFLSAFKRLR